MHTDLKEKSKGKINVLFFISSLEGGGAERVMVDLLRNINRKRIEPILVLLYPYENSPYKEYVPEDIKVIVIEKKSDNLFNKIRQFIHFMKKVKKEKPAVIMSMLTHNNIMAIMAGILFRIKVIVCEHNTLGEVIKTEEGKNILGLPVAPLVKILYRLADRVIAVSEGIKINLTEEFNISSNKIKVIYNPVDLNHITKLSSMSAEHPFFEDTAKIVIALGRLTRQKSFDILIKAFSEVFTEMDARLIILGEGSERESLKRLIEDLALTEKVDLPGFHKNPYKFLSKADIFVLSSAFEGLPMAILEAMVCGTPIISTDCWSGPRELLQNGRCGLLVPVDDVNALSEAIVRLLKDRELRGNLSRLGRERVKDFSPEKIIKQYEEIMYDAVTR